MAAAGIASALVALEPEFAPGTVYDHEATSLAFSSIIFSPVHLGNNLDSTGLGVVASTTIEVRREILEHLLAHVPTGSIEESVNR